MTSLEQLREALSHLGVPHDIGEVQYCYNISSKFEKSNTALSQGWATIGDFLGKIEYSISGELREMHNSLEAYIAASESNESQEQKAVNEANQEAETILKELGIN